MKILFVSKPNSDNFIRNYTDAMTASSKDYQLLITRDEKEVWEIEHNFDVTICEWANDLTANICKRPLKSKVVVRCHDHEIKSGRIHNINWDNVFRVWFINNEFLKDFRKFYLKNSFFLPNAVDPEPFTEKLNDNKEIAFLSIYARTRKRIDRALDLMKLLPSWNCTFRLEDWNPEVSDSGRYVNWLKRQAGPNVKWEFRNADTFIKSAYPLDDVVEFFKDKSVVISTSEREGYHYSLAYGALSGLMPCCFEWETGNPSQFWDPYVHNSIEAMADAIKNYKPSHEYRRYVIDNFSPDVLVPRLLNELSK